MSKMDGGTDVMCDMCGTSWENLPTRSLRSARYCLRDIGWTVRKIDRKIQDICPKCGPKAKP